MREVGLVSCVKSKRDIAAVPKELYTSAYFEKMRDYVEREHDAWWILSAKHGLLDPNGSPVKPYDETLRDISKAEKREWAVQIYDELEAAELLDGDVHLVLHAGEDYYGELLPLLEDSSVGEVSIPTEGLAIGETLAWYDDQS